MVSRIEWLWVRYFVSDRSTAHGTEWCQWQLLSVTEWPASCLSTWTVVSLESPEVLSHWIWDMWSGPNGPDCLKMGQIWDFFRSDFSTFWLSEPKCTEIWSEKVPDLSLSGPSERLWDQIWNSWVEVMMKTMSSMMNDIDVSTTMIYPASYDSSIDKWLVIGYLVDMFIPILLQCGNRSSWNKTSLL